MSNNIVTAIYEEAGGGMWFGTLGGGVSRYDGEGFVTFTTKDGLANDSVVAIHGPPDGAIWIGTGGGISRYDGHAIFNLIPENEMTNNPVVVVCDRRARRLSVRWGAVRQLHN